MSCLWPVGSLVCKSHFLSEAQPFCLPLTAIGRPLETTRLDRVIHLADKHAELHVPNIATPTWHMHCRDHTHGTAGRNASMLHAYRGQGKLGVGGGGDNWEMDGWGWLVLFA